MKYKEKAEDILHKIQKVGPHFSGPQFERSMDVLEKELQAENERLREEIKDLQQCVIDFCPHRSPDGGCYHPDTDCLYRHACVKVEDGYCPAIDGEWTKN